jgi:hypothetical protein
MFVRELAMFDGRSCMLLRLFVLAEIVMMGRLMVMVRGSVVVSGRLMVMLTRWMLHYLCHFTLTPPWERTIVYFLRMTGEWRFN